MSDNTIHEVSVGEEFMDGDIATRLIREIEVEKGRMTAHEGICAERYKNITDKFLEQNVKLDRLVIAAEKQAGNMSGRVIAMLSATITLLVGIAGWEAAQLYNVEPARVHETSHS